METPDELNGPLKLGVAAVREELATSVPLKVDAPEEVNGPLKVGVAAVRELKLPNEVKLDEITPVPSAVELKTVVPLISYTLPVRRLKSSEDVHAFVALTQLRVLSVVPLNVIPPPLAATSEGEAVEASSIFLSSTVRTVELTVVVVPLTVRLPSMTKLSSVLRVSAEAR